MERVEDGEVWTVWTDEAKEWTQAEPRPVDLVCLSHLRWNFVFQRPQHLMVRWARDRRVVFFEEPIWGEEGPARLELRREEIPGGRGEVLVAVPHLPHGMAEAAAQQEQRTMLDQLLRRRGIHDFYLWYYTPMALPISRHLKPRAVIYDCMDELSLFSGAPPALREREAELLRRADVVFTGGQSLYEAKRDRHPNIYPMPSSVDVAHFAAARRALPEPADQAAIPGPRLGFFGVLDERLDQELLDGVAAARPDWQIVMIGPVAKIDAAALPQRSNIHYLGMKSYAELPGYLSGWDVALLLFARNDATRFISPTKTPEYLAAGRPVVSTSIRDVVRPYGQRGLVHVADTVPEFVAAVEAALATDRAAHQRASDELLGEMSWDMTWSKIHALVEAAARRRSTKEALPAVHNAAEQVSDV